MNVSCRPERRVGRRGATFVEAALCLTVFLMVIFGIMEFGRLLWMYTTVSHLAREGTRYASVRGAESKAPTNQAQLRTELLRQAIGLDPALLTVSLVWDPNNSPGSYVRVTVSYNYSPMAPFVPSPTVSARSEVIVTQ
jgi:Flp pilus assembly protein TadG